MTYTSIFEKLLVLINIVNNSWVYIAFILISLLLIILLAFKKLSKNTCFILITLATKLVLGYTIYIYYEPISNLINKIVDTIFLNIYFPSAYAYLLILSITNIVTIVNILKPKGEKVYKTINSICFIITNFLLALILEIIAKNKIDVFAKESLFSNPNLVTLLELSVNVFILWLISLAATYIINNITERIIIAKESKKLVSDPATIDNKLTINEEDNYQWNNDIIPALNPVQAFIPDTQNKFIPNFTISTEEISTYEEKWEVPTVSIITEEQSPIISTINNESTNTKLNDNSFDLSAFIPKKQEIKPISILDENKTNATNTFEQILNNDLSITKEEPKEVSTFEDTKNTYTLNDYRIFNKMLKDIREHNQSNSVTIDKNLEYRLITKYSTETYNMFKTMLKIYSN